MPGPVKLIFGWESSFLSLVIRTVCWSKWSHVAMTTPDNTAIEAVYPDGVVETDLELVKSRFDRFVFVAVDCPDPASAIAFGRSQIGKPYDFWGVVGLGLHRDWQDDSKWWCSELVEAQLAAGGHLRFRDDVRRLTPEHSWMVL